MRSLIALGLMYAVLQGPAVAADKAIAPAGMICFGNEKFELASEISTATNNIQQYVPKGQSVRTWTTMAAIHEYPHIRDPFAFAEHMAAMVKHQNPKAHTAVGYDPETGRAIVDFVTWPIDREFVELNLFLFKRNGKNGLVAYQYAVREYEDPDAFLRDIQLLRKRAFRTMTESGFTRDEHSDNQQAEAALDSTRR